MTRGRMRRVAVAAALLPALATPVAGAQEVRDCGRIENPYAGTRYEGVDITRIRAEGVRCPAARRVARRAHRKALGLAPPPRGVRRFSWRGWQVTGDLRGAHDRYRAVKGERRVRWRF